MSTATAKDRLPTLRESDALRAMPGLNPQALIAAAIDKGAGIETLERLVQLAKDVRAITAKEAYYEAISEFQRRCPPIKKNKTANIETQGGRSYKYSYSDLGEILPTISPLMGELGLSASWFSPRTVPNAVIVVCRITHRLGHSETSGEIEIPYRSDGRMNGAQAVGSARTYAKRYSLCDALGIAPEDDDDAGSTGDDRKPTRQADRPRSSAEDRRPAESGRNPDAREASSVTVSQQAPDPNDPALVAESRVLFPDPAKSTRQDVIKKCRIEQARIGARGFRKIKTALGIDEEKDLETLSDHDLTVYLRHLEAAEGGK